MDYTYIRQYHINHGEYNLPIPIYIDNIEEYNSYYELIKLLDMLGAIDPYNLRTT